MGAAHGANVDKDGYTVFRKDRWRRAGCVMLYITELLDKCSAPVSNWRDRLAERVKITARSNLGNGVVDEYYRLQTTRRQGLKPSTWSPCPHWGFQPPSCLQEGQHSTGQAIHDVCKSAIVMFS